MCSDLRGFIVLRYKGVKVLQTFDSEGVIEHYVGKVKEDRNPHFFGPGHSSLTHVPSDVTFTHHN